VLVQGISGDKNALGYIPFAYYEPNKETLKALAISWTGNKTQDPVLPSKENVLAGTYNPLSRPLFIYVNRKSSDRPEVKQFVEFLLDHVAESALAQGNLPLQEAAIPKVKERFENRTVGTVFDGKPEIGVTVEELLARESK
jgi:phosphate transport system substrate-binding protein